MANRTANRIAQPEALSRRFSPHRLFPFTHTHVYKQQPFHGYGAVDMVLLLLSCLFTIH